MNIGIFGCSHSFGTGFETVKCAEALNTEESPWFNRLKNEGYSVILSKLFPQHNFEVVSAVGGGNLDILQNVVDYIQNKPKDMYIVQTTTWYRFVFGVLDYNNFTKQINDNLSYTTYNTDSFYHRVPNEQWSEAFGPNQYISFLPQQQNPEQGSGFGNFLWNEKKTARGMEKMREEYNAAFTVIIRDHLASYKFLNENKLLFEQLNYLSKKENLWYFHWNPPFGTEHDFRDMVTEILKQSKIKLIQSFYDKWQKKDHNKRIVPFDILSYLEETISKKRLIANHVTDGYHLDNAMHNVVVSLLLSNPKFKEALNG